MEKLKDQSFALIGVCTNPHPPGKLKEVMEKQNLPWRSFDVRSDFLAAWNNPVTPGYYVLDQNGVIRYKWSGYPGARAIDAALEKLIREMGRSGSARKE